MAHHPGTGGRYWVFILSLLLAGCVSSPRTTVSRLGREYLPAKDGQLHYRLPEGWLNATNDSPSPDNIVWLVRGDFAATMSVTEVNIDQETRLELTRRGLSRLAELTLALESGERGISVTQNPRVIPSHNTNVCLYEYVTGHPTNKVRVLLVDTGSTVYEVRVLMTENIKGEETNEVASMQDAFVQNLKW
jgi:hypothetical protein